MAEPLSKDEREAVRDRLVRVLATAAGLYARLEDDSGLERTEVRLALGRGQRHLESAAAMLTRAGAPDGR